MNFLFYIANGLVMPPAMFFAWNFYRFKGEQIELKRLWISIFILSLTAVVTSLQFIFPEIIASLNRDRHAILSGELWRLITALFIQPMGIGQCVFNTLFFISFVPLTEHLYGRSVFFIYFATGVMGQLINLYWETTPGGLPSSGGGSSTALYGVIGSLVMYIVINRKLFQKGYILIPTAVFTGAVVLTFFEDGHAPSLLVGGILGMVLAGSTPKISTYAK